MDRAGWLIACVYFTTVIIGCGQSDSAPITVPLPADEIDGATIYEARCASCHGSDLRGTDEGPTQLSIVYEPNHHSDDSYRSAIRNGAAEHHFNFGDMKPVAGITDEQIESVIAYVRAQQALLGFER
jgi:mono/diheme cytochrome c family protein